MRRVNGYLSRLAQDLDSRALVYCESGNGELWTLEGGTLEPVELGSSFRDARSSLLAMLRAFRARKKARPEDERG